MKNADLPAMPQTISDSSDGSYLVGSHMEFEWSGLTKREMFAMHAMQGELAGSANHSRPEPEDVASFAVKCADALLAELDK